MGAAVARHASGRSLVGEGVGPKWPRALGLVQAFETRGGDVWHDHRATAQLGQDGATADRAAVPAARDMAPSADVGRGVAPRRGHPRACGSRREAAAAAVPKETERVGSARARRSARGASQRGDPWMQGAAERGSRARARGKELRGAAAGAGEWCLRWAVCVTMSVHRRDVRAPRAVTARGSGLKRPEQGSERIPIANNATRTEKREH